MHKHHAQTRHEVDQVAERLNPGLQLVGSGQAGRGTPSGETAPGTGHLVAPVAVGGPGYAGRHDRAAA